MYNNDYFEILSNWWIQWQDHQIYKPIYLEKIKKEDAHFIIIERWY